MQSIKKIFDSIKNKTAKSTLEKEFCFLPVGCIGAIAIWRSGVNTTDLFPSGYTIFSLIGIAVAMLLLVVEWINKGDMLSFKDEDEALYTSAVLIAHALILLMLSKTTLRFIPDIMVIVSLCWIYKAACALNVFIAKRTKNNDKKPA